MKKLILQSTQENDIVLEPFAGSGATCLAAVECGRRFVASELEERFCEITKERLQGIAKRKKYGLTGLEADQIQQSLF